MYLYTVVTKLEISDRGRKSSDLKISINRGVENVYNQKFLYENYILSTTERKVRGVGRHLPPLKSFAHVTVTPMTH
ncbi:hypothetical protein HanIR_Chr06g0270961 [Helianthus annuus]|nr:hypothetical protein HanIR_Chr06g0270961 [Helianthus annuus]